MKPPLDDSLSSTLLTFNVNGDREVSGDSQHAFG